MEITLLTFLVLGFAAFRITRFFIIDSFFEGYRTKFHIYLTSRNGKLKFLAFKLYELTSCTWCLGFWASLVVYSLYTWNCPIDFSRIDVFNVFAIAGVQGMLHAVEPSGE